MGWLLITALSVGPASAGWLADFCEKHFITANDPFPYADTPTKDLFAVYKQDFRVVQELIYRLRAGLLTPEEQTRFWKEFNE
jgi:hypothetical protein